MGLAGLRTGTEYLKPSSGKKKKWTPFISWSDGDSKTVAFLTPIDQVAKVRMHDFVKVPADNEKGWRFEHFMCRKDPAWLAESGGFCPLCDEIGAKVVEKHTAVGLELEPITNGTPQVTGLNVVTKNYQREDGTEVSYPQWGLIRQSFGNFFNYFTAFGQKWGDITHVAFDVARVGGDRTTSYIIMPVIGIEVPDVSEYEIPSLSDVLESLGSKEKYEENLPGAEEIDQTPNFDETETTFSPAETTGEGFKTKFEQLKSQLPEGLHSKVESFTAS